MPETSYASCGDLSLAYQVFGDGPVELVWAGSFASHVELYWTMPEFGSLMEKLGTFARVLLFDKAGVGLSDPVPKVRTLDERAAEIEAVMDAAGFGKAALLGVSEGGPAAILFAATRPQRTRALILTGTTSYGARDGWDDLERDQAELRARGVRELGEDYAPSVAWIAHSQEFGRAVRSAWGSGEALKCVISSVRSMRQPGMLERMCASPGWRGRRSKRRSGSMSGRSCRRLLCRHSFSMPATTPRFRCSRAGTSPTTFPARAWSSSMARTTRPGSPIPTGSRPRLRSCSPAAMPHRRSHIAPCAPCCSPTSSPRPNVRRLRATNGGGRC